MVAAITISACGAENDGADAPPSESAASTQWDYPQTKTVDQMDEIHGVSVADPYRWLEDDVRESERVADWVAAQNTLSSTYLNSLENRDGIEALLSRFWNYEKYSLPREKGDFTFFTRNDGLQNQPVLYVQRGEEEPRILIDPNRWSEDGATALADYAPSPDGTMVAYLVQDGGSDWRTARIVETATGETLGDEISWIKFSGLDWAKDGSGFYYSRYPAPEGGAEFQSLNLNQAVYFHRIGDDQDADALTYARPDRPDHGFSAEVSSDGETLFVTVWKGTDEKYEVVLIDLSDPDATPLELVTGFHSDYSYAGTANGKHYFRTDDGAPRGKIVAVPADRGAWEEIVPQSENVLTAVNIVGGKIVAEYMADVKSLVRLFNLGGETAGSVEMPGVGSAYGFRGEPADTTTYFGFESFNQPETIYRLEIETGETTIFKQPETVFDPANYVVEQVFYPSKDGTKIPMFIARRKDLDMSAPQPTLLYGYGGFNISLTPSFSVTRMAWIDMGGVLAVANLRGGGEYGKEWHNAGRLGNKQNVFDDFIAAAEHLIADGVTTAGQLAVQGGSNGGLLVGAVVNQRPDLFAAAQPAVGVMDMVRFTQFTAGRFWVDDYGDPANEDDFETLYAYSPYHNIESGREYPAILVTTADTDDRVVPGHSFKYVAALQSANLGSAPHLIRIETRAGHGAGKPTEKIIEEYADIWAFLGHHTGLKPRFDQDEGA
ncbi:MAG: prolyl oligopeptidase family serine peptidase [Pseudomonadota bacterium]